MSNTEQTQGVETIRQLQARIAELERSEQAAREDAEDARRRLHDLFKDAPAIICLLRGPQHIYELANPLYLQVAGKQDIIGKPIREALPELAGQDVYEQLDRAYTTGEPFIGKEMKVTLNRNNAKPADVFLNLVYQPLRNAQGEIDGILIHGVDVSELVQAREDIKRSQDRLRLAQQAGNIGSFEWNIQRGKTIWTPELEALYGLPAGTFGGTVEDWIQLIHPDDQQQAQEKLHEAVRDGTPYNDEFRVVWPDGSIHWLLGKGDVFLNKQNQPIRVFGVNIDITERKEAEEELNALYQRVQDLNANLENTVLLRTEALQQANTELERSNKELQDFAYIASHDLQEPLRKIQAFGNLLEEEHAAALGEGNAYLERILNAATRMRVLIDDLLTFSRVTSKAQPFTPIDLSAVAQQVVDDLSESLEATHGRVELSGFPTIEADPLQMYQMLQNLLGNAIKFHRADVHPVVKVGATVETITRTVPLQLTEAISTEPGQEQPSEVSITQMTTTQVVDQCILTVEDNGIGFDEKYVDRIFTMFQRLHGKGTYEGTGIGLAVVRKIVDRHGGTINVKSTVGEGTTFIVTLPVHH